MEQNFFLFGIGVMLFYTLFFCVFFMFLLELLLDFGSKDAAQRFFKSVKPELDEDFLRSKTVVSLKDGALVISISASDKTALRASLNALLKPLVLFTQLEEFG